MHWGGENDIWRIASLLDNGSSEHRIELVHSGNDGGEIRVCAREICRCILEGLGDNEGRRLRAVKKHVHSEPHKDSQ